jgi:hypothetical protein
MATETKRSLTQNELSGRATGALIFDGFGALWILIALYARQILSLADACAVLIGFTVLLAASYALMRQAKRLEAAPANPAMWRIFRAVNVLQAVVIFGAISILNRLHLGVYNLSVITLVVGLHLFPLARLFRYKLHHATGSVLVVWALVSAWLAPAAQVQSVTALGTGAILWLSAAATLTLAFLRTRRSTRMLTPHAA